VWDVAAPLPLLMIADLLGFEADLHDQLLEWSDDLIRATDATMTPEIATRGANAMMAFREVQLQVIAERRASPRDDLISTLCHASIDGEALDDESILNETLLILIGGDETTRHVITCGMLALLDHPDQAELLADDDRLPVGVEELLRWVSPVKNMARTVTRDLELRDQQLREGDQVMLFYPSANRDEEVFDAADRLDVTRNPNPHLAFGFGPHFCLGASLARLELTVMFREVLRRLPDLRLATTDPVPHRRSNFITGPEAMPVEFTPTALVGA
jgi:cytochrome P450 family 142 subfamily A polypeptide 1